MAAPVRRRPGAGSPLAVEVEPVRTPATAPAPVIRAGAVPAPRVGESEAAQSAPMSPAAAVQPPSERRLSRRTAAPAVPEVREVPDAKKPVTVQMRMSLKQRAESAVLLTGGGEGAPRSFAALVDEAVERELARLAEHFNGGEPFSRHSRRTEPPARPRPSQPDVCAATLRYALARWASRAARRPLPTEQAALRRTTSPAQARRR